jgi:ATP-dependent DNA ligase
MARRDAEGVRLYTRNGNDFTKRFLLVVASVTALPARSCLIDGEATSATLRNIATVEESPPSQHLCVPFRGVQ